MKNKRILLLGLLALFLSTLALAGSALAAPAPTTTKVTFHYLKSHTASPGKAWMDDEGFHIRDQIDHGFVWGDINGSAVVVFNADYVLFSAAKVSALAEKRPAPDSGTAFGSVVIYENNLEFAPSVWTGNWIYSVLHSTVIEGQLVAWNDVTNRLMRIQDVSQNPDGSLTYEGVIEVPRCLGMKCPKS
ncbi:MAG: hypothetical protein R3335_07580 [Anaerolineales bacterium]|nr:hypothetical protein [Anaerolineales bacterium]